MSMFNDPKATFPLQAQSGFAGNFASVCKGQLTSKKVYLDVSIPATNRYLASMVQHVQQAITGQQTPKEALDAMTAEFEDATETYDRDRRSSATPNTAPAWSRPATGPEPRERIRHRRMRSASRLNHATREARPLRGEAPSASSSAFLR
ncbi:hypothetical protein [Lichenifustis flavocetrariae]|uniref:Uncharacterized protein n=1 Tax=Lichenifustis flavocetrariae TaxID=2949735 RepID=A0AA41YZJ6_9HYPH|nr:hypothetical protein [Lichenifustis flavocetrariae]MCW6507778.1 hypothetical protein [Lichenifustis flavocetrariae]